MMLEVVVYMGVDKVVDEVADMVVNMEVDKVADMLVKIPDEDFWWWLAFGDTDRDGARCGDGHGGLQGGQHYG